MVTREDLQFAMVLDCLCDLVRSDVGRGRYLSGLEFDRPVTLVGDTSCEIHIKRACLDIRCCRKASESGSDNRASVWKLSLVDERIKGLTEIGGRRTVSRWLSTVLSGGENVMGPQYCRT